MASTRPRNNLFRLLGNTIRKRRRNLGLSQEELAFRSQLHRTYIADIERGARNPSLASINRLAKALEYSLSALFAETQAPLKKGRAAGENKATTWDMEEHLVDILLVEDNPHDAELAIHALKRCNLGNRIHTVTDGVEALEFLFGSGIHAGRLVRQGPRVILLDLRLPIIDGLEVLRRIKADPRTRTIPVIVLTVSGEEKDLRECRRLGVEHYIVKPVDFEHFCLTMARIGLHWLLLDEGPPNGSRKWAPARSRTGGPAQ